MTNIIGDIAGRYDTLMALLKKMPDDEVVSVGDMVDRGPRSKEVVEWFMKNGKAIFGNHEHLMLDYVKQLNIYQQGIWFYNGGGATWNSFGQHVSDDVVKWMENLPLYMEFGDVFVSHAFVANWDYGFEDCLKLIKAGGLNENSIIWCRRQPKETDKYAMQIAGHNAMFGLTEFKDRDNKTFAYCIDDSGNGKLTGIHIPSFTVYQQNFLE